VGLGARVTYCLAPGAFCLPCPADWHKEQAGMGMEDREGDYVYNGTGWVKAESKANTPFLTPSGKWLTIVTDIGEVLGFEIVRDVL